MRQSRHRNPIAELPNHDGHLVCVRVRPPEMNQNAAELFPLRGNVKRFDRPRARGPRTAAGERDPPVRVKPRPAKIVYAIATNDQSVSLAAMSMKARTFGESSRAVG